MFCIMAWVEEVYRVGWIPRCGASSWVSGLISSSTKASELVGHLWAFSEDGISTYQSTRRPSRVAYSGARAFELGYCTHVYLVKRVLWL